MRVAKALLVHAAAWKEAQGIANATHVQRFHQLRLDSAANDELGRTAADVDHQALVIDRRQRVRRADVDQARLFAAADDLDRKAQRLLGQRQEIGGILGDAQRIGRYHAYRRRRKTAQAFTETA